MVRSTHTYILLKCVFLCCIFTHVAALWYVCVCDYVFLYLICIEYHNTLSTSYYFLLSEDMLAGSYNFKGLFEIQDKVLRLKIGIMCRSGLG